MVDLAVKYLGLTLKNPLIAGSSGLTNSIENLQKIEENGAGAVVLKSIFEEQIRYETDNLINQAGNERMQPMHKGFNEIMDKRSYDYAEAFDYISDFAKEHTLNEYLGFIEKAKKSVSIPVIASINCVYSYDWHYFAKRIQDSGADAIELNIYILPSDLHRTGLENENIYFQIAAMVKKYVTIPVALKISYYFSSVSQTIINLSNSGINGLVLFNRPFSPDIDIDKFQITSSNILSEPNDYSQTLRWIAILSGRLGCDLAAATGIHDHTSMIKQLLAGATAVQATSVMYRSGFESLGKIVSGLEIWMNAHHFNKIDDFRGKLSQINLENPAVFERVQFMKLYSQIE
jgi:dihydroorotate dehydrogenase (fumarate)